jgi:CSLREA domain-containing protein
MQASIGKRAAARRLLVGFGALALMTPAAIGVLAPVPVYAATSITVTTTADELTNNGNCSLREAIRAANLDVAVDSCPAGSGADRITLPAGTYRLAIPGTGEDTGLTGDLDLTASVTLEGASASTTIIDGQALDGVLHVLGTDSVVVISRVTITNGSTEFAIGNRGAGGIANGQGGGGAGPIVPGGTVTVSDSVIQNNRSRGSGGGIQNWDATMTIADSTISGNSARGDGGGAANLGNDAKLTIRRSTVSGNSADGVDVGFGGGLRSGGGRLAVIASTISGNTARTGGGGISVATGTHMIVNSTISGNTSRGGGGIEVAGATRATLLNTTVTGNTAAEVGSGSGLVVFGPGLVQAANTLIAGNLPLGQTGTDCTGSLSSLGYNLVGTIAGCTIVGVQTSNRIGLDPRLGPLRDNGGPTFTHALLPGSPAIDAGNPAPPDSSQAACQATDQRGSSRPQDGNGDGRAVCDIGAFEVGPPVTYAILCALSRELVSNRAMATGMCTVLDAARLNERLGVPKGKARELDAYRRLVAASLRAHFISADNAATLTGLSNQL